MGKEEGGLGYARPSPVAHPTMSYVFGRPTSCTVVTEPRNSSERIRIFELCTVAVCYRRYSLHFVHLIKPPTVA